MQNNDPLYQLIRTVTGSGANGATSPAADALVQSGGSALADAVTQNTTQLARLQNLFQSQTDATNQNTQAVTTNTTTLGQSGAGATAANIAKTATSFLGGDLLMSPIVSGLMKLFGGGGDSQPAATFEKFSLPAPVNVAAGIGSAGLGSADYGQNGLPRVASAQAANVTVQVNAMDSQSFLDRSSDIASAVRRAMLESSSLNDVVSEL